MYSKFFKTNIGFQPQRVMVEGEIFLATPLNSDIPLGFTTSIKKDKEHSVLDIQIMYQGSPKEELIHISIKNSDFYIGKYSSRIFRINKLVLDNCDVLQMRKELDAAFAALYLKNRTIGSKLNTQMARDILEVEKVTPRWMIEVIKSVQITGLNSNLQNLLFELIQKSIIAGNHIQHLSVAQTSREEIIEMLTSLSDSTEFDNQPLKDVLAGALKEYLEVSGQDERSTKQLEVSRFVKIQSG